MLIIGIDPGLDGGIAVIDGKHLEYLETIPTSPKMGFIKRQVDGRKLAEMIRVFPDAEVWLEGVASRPGQGVASVFSFGDTFGCIRGVLEALNMKVNTVVPSKWKKDLTERLNVPLSSKDDVLKAIKDLYPSLILKKKDHNLAEAILIALYGRNQNGKHEI